MGLESLDIDPAFIVSPEHRPNTKHCDFSGDQIPLIDLSPLNSTWTSTSLDSLVTQIRAACRDWGFFQVINHGVSPQLLETLHSEAAKFFSLPLQEKSKVKRNFDNPFGFYDTELTKNVRDWKEVFDFTCRGIIRLPSSSDLESHETLAMANQWPENPPLLREACEKYAEAVEKLSFRLLELISRSLGLPSEYFNSKFEDHTSFLRLNHYPPCPVPELALGVSRHKDVGALTVLAQDEVGGLQVRRKDGEWIGVKPIPNSFVINVGDCMQVLGFTFHTQRPHGFKFHQVWRLLHMDNLLLHRLLASSSHRLQAHARPLHHDMHINQLLKSWLLSRPCSCSHTMASFDGYSSNTATVILHTTTTQQCLRQIHCLRISDLSLHKQIQSLEQQISNLPTSRSPVCISPLSTVLVSSSTDGTTLHILNEHNLVLILLVKILRALINNTPETTNEDFHYLG